MLRGLKSHRLRPGTDAADLTASDTERQLEGRAERIAVALRPHAELETLLSGRRWRRGLLKRPERVPALVAHAEALEEALERVHRRAASEAWSGDVPVLRAARELSARRERLAGLARRRLEAWVEVPPDLPLEKALTRLNALVRQPVSRTLVAGEVLAFESAAWWRPRWRRFESAFPRGLPRLPVWTPYAVGALGFIIALTRLPGLRWVGLGLIALGFGVGVASFILRVLRGPLGRWVLWPLLRPVLWPVLGLGRVRLTNERLLWLPVLGEPQEVRWATIADDGVRVDPDTLDVRVTGTRRLHARGLLNDAEVVALVELHRLPRLRDAALAGLRLWGQVAVLPATLGGHPGHCVLRPQGLSFIPQGTGPEALGALTGRPTPLRGFDANRLVEALRWLPEAEFDACVARVVKATGGTSWAAKDARYVEGTPEWGEIRIERSTQEVLVGRVTGVQDEVLRGLLDAWPRRKWRRFFLPSHW
ncbi:hypothetical protein D7Y13_22335 [Corallococcus praedator]|uniref:Uncharacterized protein n=1 Tax=Corallococcus praedator TaxID=2316724 RepID=A0ABX9QGD0_9BACT|nr:MULTISPECIES: hypothetical protein [Corallococcus]RKH26005.1 hypothetical protein D7X75_29060 [Corallococcus sp. CA031C]RKI03330.1 hypothetical protein D7Y13_22335 [Corallococcus praedator]